VDAEAVELRVLGCLIEKQRTTPDQYPLSLNALRLACNQTTNREPVVDYDEPTIRDALHRLSDRGWARLASGAGSRAIKYRHLLDDALRLSPSELALLAVLMLRGGQTPGELKQRVERLHPFESLADVEATLDGLIGRDLVVRLERRPGQKEQRFEHRLGAPVVAAPLSEPPVPGAEPAASLAERVAALEERVARLEGTAQTEGAGFSIEDRSYMLLDVQRRASAIPGQGAIPKRLT
jgi:uncharacterized protein YceH (UPF0502 family)